MTSLKSLVTQPSATLSPSGSRAYLQPAPASSGQTPIPRLSRTRKGSFSKSHEDLLANREAPLSSPLYGAPNTSGFSNQLQSSASAMIGSQQSQVPPPLWSQGPPAPASYSDEVSSPHSMVSSSRSSSSNTSLPLHQYPPSNVAITASAPSAIPPKIGSLKSASSVRLVRPSSISTTSSSAHSSSSSISSTHATNNPTVAPSRVPPNLKKLGKSQSESGGPAIASSILAWRAGKESAHSGNNSHQNAPPGISSLIFESRSGSKQSETGQLASPSSNASNASRKQQLCMFFIEGNCRYGDNCKFVHGLVCPLCKKPCLFPDDPQQNEKHNKTCRLKIEIEESKDLMCAMCKLKVVENNRKFGVLPDCNDVLCVPCLKEYRSTTSKAECPICQTPSPFLIPSHCFPQTAERKAELTEAFKLKMSKIACKYFDHGNGVCKYGSTCHFHHNIDSNVPPAKTASNAPDAAIVAAPDFSGLDAELAPDVATIVVQTSSDEQAE